MIKHLLSTTLLALLSVTALHAADAKVDKAKPSAAEPLQYENCKSYDYPGRHAAILKIKAELNPQVVFIGDSITHHWGGQPTSHLRAGETVLKSDLSAYRTLNLGFGHDRTQHVIWRLQNGEIDGISPDWVVIHIGTNNINSKYSAQEILDGIRVICTEVRNRVPKAKIVLMAILPRGRQPGDGGRMAAAAANKLIMAYGAEQKFITLDLTSQYVGADGVLPKELMPDGLHMSVEGYRIWAKALKAIFEGKQAP